MQGSIPSVIVLSLGLVSLVTAQYDSALVGTWTTKSKKVLTGPVRLAADAESHTRAKVLIQGCSGLLRPRQRPVNRARARWHFLLVHHRWIL